MELLDLLFFYWEATVLFTETTVIVIVFNSAHCLRTNLEFFTRLPHLILVDNASSDDSVGFIKKEIKNATLICNQKNLGFGAANNQAIRLARTPYLFLMNPDCEISLDSLATLIDYTKQYPTAAILAPQLQKKNGEIDLSYRWPRSYWTSTGDAAEGDCCVGFVPGASMLLNVRNSRQLFFDESYFLYYEDDDLCQRVFEERSQIIILPKVRATHQLGGSVKRKIHLLQYIHSSYHMTQSDLIYSSRYVSADFSNKKRVRIVVVSFAKLIISLVFLKPKSVSRYLGRLWGALEMKKIS